MKGGDLCGRSGHFGSSTGGVSIIDFVMGVDPWTCALGLELRRSVFDTAFGPYMEIFRCVEQRMHVEMKVT